MSAVLVGFAALALFIGYFVVWGVLLRHFFKPDESVCLLAIAALEAHITLFGLGLICYEIGLAVMGVLR